MGKEGDANTKVFLRNAQRYFSKSNCKGGTPLREETGITRGQIRLYRLMDIRYYHQGFDLQMYVGKLDEDVLLKEEANPLLWLPLTEDFTDRDRFAGEQNIAHIMNVALEYPILA